jgi:hypothetical protein
MPFAFQRLQYSTTVEYMRMYIHVPCTVECEPRRSVRLYQGQVSDNAVSDCCCGVGVAFICLFYSAPWYPFCINAKDFYLYFYSECTVFYPP